MRICLRALATVLLLGTVACMAPKQAPRAPVDIDEAYDSLEALMLAAEKGHPLAQLELGERYLEGRGIPADKISAYLWLRLAAVHGIESAAAARDELSASMTPEQIEQAEVLVRQWGRYYFTSATEQLSAAERAGVPHDHDAPDEQQPDHGAGPATRKALESGGKRKKDD